MTRNDTVIEVTEEDRYVKLNRAWIWFVLCSLLAVPAVFSGVFWFRSRTTTDDIFFGRKSFVYRFTGVTRFKSAGGGMWLEFRPEVIRGDTTDWQTFPSRGEYCFLLSPGTDLGRRMGFLCSRKMKTFVLPYWLPITISFGTVASLLSWRNVHVRHGHKRADMQPVQPTEKADLRTLPEHPKRGRNSVNQS